MLNRNYRLLLLICLTLISGCSFAKDYQYFLQHPEAIGPTLAACQAAGSRMVDQGTCSAAQQAQDSLRPLLVEALQNRAEFGQRILHAEMQLAQYQTEYHRLQSLAGSDKLPASPALAHAKSNVAAEQAVVDSYLAIIRLIGM